MNFSKNIARNTHFLSLIAIINPVALLAEERGKSHAPLRESPSFQILFPITGERVRGMSPKNFPEIVTI